MKAKAEKKAPKRGRPPQEQKDRTVRVSPRIPEHIAAQIESAAAWRGMSMSGFIIEAARREAEETLEKREVLKLSEEEIKGIAKLILNPPETTEYAEESARFTAEHVRIRS